MEHEWDELSIFGKTVMVCRKCGDVQGRKGVSCPGVDETSKGWELVRQLLMLNPNVSYARIGREVGYTGQSVGVIAKMYGMPPRRPGGFCKPDERHLRYPKKVRKNNDSPI